jgi:hypothetical protein
MLLVDLELILGKLASNHEAMGILTYSYMGRHGSQVRPCYPLQASAWCGPIWLRAVEV